MAKKKPPVDVFARGKALASAMLTATRGQDIEDAQLREFEGATARQQLQIVCAMGGSLMWLINEYRNTEKGQNHIDDFVRRLDNDVAIADLEAVISHGGNGS